MIFLAELAFKSDRLLESVYDASAGGSGVFSPAEDQVRSGSSSVYSGNAVPDYVRWVVWLPSRNLRKSAAQYRDTEICLAESTALA